jgi:hypothetical protein
MAEIRPRAGVRRLRVHRAAPCRPDFGILQAPWPTIGANLLGPAGFTLVPNYVGP